jgi:sugar lactone lactonase YvrE
VPTDVEVAGNGDLIVSSLPGGPEDGSLGALGSVWRVKPTTGRATKVAGGLISPVGVAVGRNGDIYVSQLFAGVVSRIKHGSHTAKPWRKLVFPGDLEQRGGAIFATGNVLSGSSGQPGDVPNGQIVRLRG